MPTFKVVVIGASGVGKTSLRGQYISARFSSSYRATIGADFITKTLPPMTPDGEPITLQIWDTAGQERFSSLAAAFFRGADAAILMYDVTTPDTLYALSKWWAEFRDKAPVADEDLRGFCVAVVGNKTDLLDGLGEDEDVVSPTQGVRFVRVLIPQLDTPPHTPRPLGALAVTSGDEEDADGDYDDGEDPLASSQLTARPQSADPISILRHPHLSPYSNNTSPSQLSFFHPKATPRNHSTSRASSHSRGGASTITSALTIYHTPSSSVFSDSASEYWHSARSSYAHSSAHSYNEHSPVAPLNMNGFFPHRRRSPSARSASEVTITPARFSKSSSSLSLVTTADAYANNSVSPSPIDTSASPFASRTDVQRALDAGPSSAALSPLPYPQHFPFGANGTSTKRHPTTAVTPTAVTPTTSASASVTSLLDAVSQPPKRGKGKQPSEHERQIPQWLTEADLDVGASGAAHFRVSARTGDGVSDVFGWIARRLLVQYERREAEMGWEDNPRASITQPRHRQKGGAEERLRLNANGGSGNRVSDRCC
ncbi:unnamed protein product [Mycena citricolor]|uniref:Ras-domain-containing protein n=1 Tax=Mycena citricolor TaxID=2018698 RepID=A0AAD2HRQ9_9AGAR|nr:unnamed protein product [Mycena citricolor]